MNSPAPTSPVPGSLEPISDPPGPLRTLAAQVGNTPLVSLPRLGRPVPGGAAIVAKLESKNPGGSVKDRAASYMLQDALVRSLLKPGMRILDSTSGNTGIALAMLGAARGIPVTLCLPANANEERRKILAAYGAEVILTDPLEGSDGAIREARRLAAENHGLYHYMDQYSNAANARAHFETTGPEIWRQTRGAVTHLVVGLGTTGTMMGTGAFLKEQNPGITLVAVQPDSPFHGLEGLKHLATALVPPIYDPALVDLQETCSTEEAQEWTRRLAREEGILVGVSSGANFAVARRVAARLGAGALVVAIFCDTGERYLSERFWSSGRC